MDDVLAKVGGGKGLEGWHVTVTPNYQLRFRKNKFLISRHILPVSSK
jgi:hypothetical protein